MQDIDNALESQSPSSEGVLALYKPYQGAELCEWLYGEYIEQGWQREYDGVIYECIAETAVANTYSPDVATSVWVEVNND